MHRWTGKVALVTGASGSIGIEITKALAKNGLKVIPVARQLDKLKDLAATIKREYKVDAYPISCDVRKEEDLLKVFKWANAELGGVDVLVNNAGVISNEAIIADATENYRKIMDVNVIAMAICSREFVQSVKQRKTSGHIVNINSVAGHNADLIPMHVSLYSSSKYAVTGMSLTLRSELEKADIDVKVTSISPGAVETDMLKTIASDDLFKQIPKLQNKDIANAVIYALNTPPGVEIAELTIRPHKSLTT